MYKGAPMANIAAVDITPATTTEVAFWVSEDQQADISVEGMTAFEALTFLLDAGSEDDHAAILSGSFATKAD